MSKRTQSSDDDAQDHKRIKSEDSAEDEEMEDDSGGEQIVNSAIKIDRDKILNLNELNIDKCVKKKVQILSLGACESLQDAQKKIVNFNVDDFPNIFVFTIKLQEFDECTEEFKDTVRNKFTDNRPLLIEISSEETTQFCFKRRESDFFISLNLKNGKNLLKQKIARLGLKGDVLLLILNSSLLDADYSTVIEYFKDRKEDPITRAINAGDELCICVIKLFIDFSSEIKKAMVFKAIEMRNFGMFLVAINVFDENKITNEHVEPLLYIQKDSHNVFTAAIESKSAEIVKMLLKFAESYQHFFTFELFEKAFDAVMKTESFEVFEELKSADFKLSSDEILQRDEIIKKGELQLEAISTLHENISNGNLDKVKKITKKYKHLRVCRGKLEVCALEKSIECEKFDIYAYLCCQNFESDQRYQLESKIKKLSPEARTQLRHEVDKYLIENPEAYIGKIISNSKFGPQSPIASEDVREMLLDLQHIDEVKAIIPTVAHAEVQANFDYKRTSVCSMVPGGGENTLGVAYNAENRLYVGKNADKNQQYGTFVHELSHIVLNLVYENDSLPYCKGDTERETQWKKIVDDLREYCEKNPKIDPIISRAFGSSYTTDQQYKEMAVKVNELQVYYRNEPKEIHEIRKLRPNHFDFNRLFAFNDLVLKDLNLKNVYPLIKLNNEFGLIKEIEKSPLQVKISNDEVLEIAKEKVPSTSKLILLTTNVPQLMLSKISQEIQALSDNKLNLKALPGNKLNLKALPGNKLNLKALPGNKLNLKVKNIFIDSKKLNQVYLRKYFESFIAKSEVVRLVIKLENLEPKTLEFLDFLNNLKAKFLCFCVLSVTERRKYISDNDKNKIRATFRIRRTINTLWDDLTEQSKKHVESQKINFQGKPLKASNIVLLNQDLEPQLFAILCSDTEIKVNCSSEVESLVNFIPRFIKMSKSISSMDSMIAFVGAYKMKSSFFLSVKEFVAKTVHDEGFMRIVLICDSAGSGKTTLLKKIQETFNENYKDHWISFISLRDYVNELSGGEAGSFEDFMAKLLNLNELGLLIFIQKFTQGKVKILFDGFDEISHVCKANTLQLFKLFKETSGKNQIFITSRAYVERNLEKELKTTAFSLKVLDDIEQIQFLSHIWKNSHNALKFIKTCAEALVEKISSITVENASMIGVPLILQGLAEALKDKINENFDDEIHNLNIADVYEKIIDKYLEALCLRFPNDFFKNFKKPSSLMHVLQYLAVVYIFDKEQASALGLSHDEYDWPLKEIARCGIISYDQVNKNSQFNYETCAEYLVAQWVFLTIKNVDEIASGTAPCEHHCIACRTASGPLKFVIKILSEEKFKVTRMFLNNMLERVENIESLKILKSKIRILMSIKEGNTFINILKFAVEESLIHFFEFWLKMLEVEPFMLQQDISHNLHILNELLFQLLSHIVPSCQNSMKFERFLNFLFEFHSSNVYSHFLIKPDENGDTFFHHLAWRCINEKNIEIFWRKIEEQKLDEDQIKNIFFMTDHRGDNVLHCMFYFTKNFNQNNLHNVPKSPKVHMKKMMKIIEIMQKHLSPKDQIKLVLSPNKEGESFLLQSCADSTTFDFTSKLIVDPIKFTKILTSKYMFKFNILHYVIWNGILEAFDFYWKKIEESSLQGSLDIKEMLMSKTEGNHSVLELSACKMLSFSRVLELTLSACDGKDEIENLLCQSIYGEFDLILIVAFSGDLKNLRLLFDKLSEVFGAEFIKNLLKDDNFERARLLFLDPLDKNLNAEFLNFIWSIIKNYLTEEDDIVDLFKEKDEDGDNLLFVSIIASKSTDNLELFLEKVKEVFVCDDDLKEYLLTTGEKDVNILMLTVIKEYEETFFFLFKDYFLKNFELEEFIYKINKIGENIFHLLTRLGTNAMFECFMNEMMKKLSKDKIIELLKIPNIVGHDALFLLNMNDKKRLIFLSYAKEKFNEDELKELFRDDNFSIHDMLSTLSSLRDAFENIKIDLRSDNADKHRKVLEQLGKLKSLLSFSKDKFGNLFEEGEIPMQDLEGLFNKMKQDLSNEDHLKFLNSEDTEGNTMFHRFIIDFEPKEFIRILWMKIKGLDKQSKKSLLLKKGANGLNALHLSILHKNEALFEFLFKEVYSGTLELQEFIYETNDEKENLFHKIARFGSHQMVKSVIEKIADKLSADEIRNLIKIPNKVDENVLHMIAKNNDDQSINALFEVFDKGLEDKEMRDLLSAKGSFSRIPLHYAVELNTPEVLRIFLSNYEHYFTDKTEILALLEIDDNQNNKNIVELASERLEERQILAIITEFKHRMENEIN